MAWKTLCDGVSLEEAADAVANQMREMDRKREEWLSHQTVSQSKTNPQILKNWEWEDNFGQGALEHPRIKLAKGLQKHHCCASCVQYDPNSGLCLYHQEPMGIVALACERLPEWEC